LSFSGKLHDNALSYYYPYRISDNITKEETCQPISIAFEPEQSDFPTTAIELLGTKIFLQQGPRGARALGSHLEPSDNKRRAKIEDELQKLEVGQSFLKSDHFLPYVKARIQLFYKRF